MSNWDRRDFLGGAALFALAIGIPVAAVRLSSLDALDAPTPRQRSLFRTVGELVIPRTDTKGAGEVGVGDFVLIALAHGLDGTRRPVSYPDDTLSDIRLPVRRDGSLRYAEWLERELDRRANGDFLRRATAEQDALLAELDAEAFPPGPANGNPSPWCKLKSLILTGYYTSEAGASEELRYELVPGRFDPDLPQTPDTRAFSSDWTAVEFG